MTVADVRDLFSFDNWATARLLTAVSSLSEQQFSTELRSRFPSLRDTVAHILAEDWMWLRRTDQAPAAVSARERQRRGRLRRRADCQSAVVRKPSGGLD